MPVGRLQHLEVDGGGIDSLGMSGSRERNGLTGGSGIRVGLIVQEDEGEARSRNGDGTGIGARVARNIDDVQFALKTTVGFEVGTESLTGPSEVTLDGDVVGKEVLDPDGRGCPSRLASLTTADGDSDAQVMSTRIVIQIVEEGDPHGCTILVDGIAGSGRVCTVDGKVDDLRLVGPAENLGHGKSSVVHRTFAAVNNRRDMIMTHVPMVHWRNAVWFEGGGVKGL